MVLQWLRKPAGKFHGPAKVMARKQQWTNRQFPMDGEPTALVIGLW